MWVDNLYQLMQIKVGGISYLSYVSQSESYSEGIGR